MRIGLIEFLLILAIASLTVGPRVALFVDRWMRRANRANAMAARRRAEYAAQMAIERDAMLKRFRTASKNHCHFQNHRQQSAIIRMRFQQQWCDVIINQCL